MELMAHRLKAEVKNGRLVMDEPTDLPNGTVVELEEVDPFEDMDAEERERLHRVLAESRKQHEAGEGIPLAEALKRLSSI